MGFFEWFGSEIDYLVDQMFSWLGEAYEWFIKSIISGLRKIWDTVIATALYTAFGVASVLYVIFYAGAMLGETIMEIWDPNYHNTKPSQIFKLQQAPQNSPLPTQRSQAQILLLER